MKDIEFPIFKTKIEGLTRKFNLNDPKERRLYFELKAGPEINKLKDYLKENTFIVYMLGKKNSGKGTYSKMFAEIINPEKVDHFSIGDMIRAIDKELQDKESKKELILFLEKNYRGFLPLKEIILSLEERNTRTLLPSELILALAKREIAKRGRKALFLDGFPRDLDQINFSLFFRELIGYRDDPDVFVLIDVPEAVIDERLKYRRVCPACKTSRNLKLFPTKEVGYDQESKEFYLICDNPNCKDQKLVQKEGDELGIQAIRERLITDEKLIKQAFSLYGIPKVLLRNSIPVAEASKCIDDYESTPEYSYEWLPEKNEVKVIEKPLQFQDDRGVPSYSLLAASVVLSLIKQMAEVLQL